MDVSNEHLRHLLERTDEAFRALMEEPSSDDLNDAYEQAKEELDHYVTTIKASLSDP